MSTSDKVLVKVPEQTKEDLEIRIAELEKKLVDEKNNWLSTYKDLEKERKKNENLRTQMRGIGLLLMESTTEKKKY